MTIYGHYLNIYKTPLNSTVEAVFFVICKAIIFNQHPAFSAFSQHFALGNIIFGLFGAPRGPIFQISRASGLPESLFLEILRLRDSPTVHFLQKQLVGASRNIVFPNFNLSGCPEAPLSPFFARRSRAKNDFQHFLAFPRGESQFSLLFRFPSQGKTVFCCFLVFPHKGKPIFAEF